MNGNRVEAGEQPRQRRGYLAGLVWLIVAVMVVGLTGCETVEKLAGGIRKPRVKVVGAEVTGLSFEAISLQFDVEVDNPNPIGIEMAGFDYELLMDGSTFILSLIHI